MTMRILVLGAYGMLGHKLVDTLRHDFDVYATCRSPKPHLGRPVLAEGRLISEVNAEDILSIASAFARVRPDVVLNCIGVIKQLEAAKHPIPSITVNALFPHQLAELCRAAGTRLIHFSTDCVFSGDEGNYSPEHPSDARDLYGRSKYLGEVGGPGCLTIRSSIIGPELEGKHGLIEWFLAQRGKHAKGFRKAIYSGFPTIEMANIVARIIREHPKLEGVWQVASAPISKYDLLRGVNEQLGLGITLDPDDFFVCDRSLDGSLFATATGYQAPDWQTLTAAMANDIASYVK